MMEKSFAFNSINRDRRYKAEDFASYFASFIGNGVFPNPSTGLQVISNNDMTVAVKTGKGWINGYYYQNTSDFILKLDVADGVLDRIDRIVLRLDFSTRLINLKVKKGTFGSSPKVQTLQRDADAYELGIADIKITKGTITILQSNITDLRLNKEVCGVVCGVVDQVDTTTIFNQYLEWYKNITGKTEKELQNIKENLETDFNIWIDGVKNILSGDVAGNLLNLINKNKDSIDKLEQSTTTQLADITTKQGDLINLKTTNKTNLVNAVNELFTNANNGKQNWVDVIGSPLLNTDTFSTLKDKTQNLKNILATNLTAKEQSASGIENLDSLINKIVNINVGKRFATGSRTLTNMSKTDIYTITGLSFTPSKVIVSAYFIAVRGYKFASYQMSSNTDDLYDQYGRPIFGIYSYGGEGVSAALSRDYKSSRIFDNGFNIIIGDVSSSDNGVVKLTYWALE